MSDLTYNDFHVFNLVQSINDHSDYLGKLALECWVSDQNEPEILVKKAFVHLGIALETNQVMDLYQVFSESLYCYRNKIRYDTDEQIRAQPCVIDTVSDEEGYEYYTTQSTRLIDTINLLFTDKKEITQYMKRVFVPRDIDEWKHTRETSTLFIPASDLQSKDHQIKRYYT